ncbi:hypothetical protein [Tautonia sociabilis]|uniref:Exosortase-associated EpsI family protein n=1 Tax=Tautonia sociabilis TaxID=2080755 RepID=A0A432MCU2_9BACT|nr:hypothetical protein [Tautonia sociabilis]RUL82315.1 hypothetical protein TsocGM_23655 [Tautonia sociabilis]
MATFGSRIRPLVRLALLAAVASALAPRPSPGPAASGTDRRRDPSASARERPEDGNGGGGPTSAGSSLLDEAPPEVLAFLSRVLERLPEPGEIDDDRFDSWTEPGSPTRAAMGIKPVPGLDPDALISRVLDVDGYTGPIAFVEASRSLPPSGDAPGPPGSVRFYQRIQIPGIARVQQKAVLLDLGTVRGYRVACWSLLPEETSALNPKEGARASSNVGAWLAAPGVVGYALHSWPRREDVNALQWLSLTAGSDAMARSIVETTIDGMARWAREPGPAPHPGPGPE